MIDIKSENNCCGCKACEQICPKGCISFSNDEKGFAYPKVDHSICVDCHLCERVCPMLNSLDFGTPLSVEAISYRNEQVRTESSSGGVFSAIAEKVIRDGGVVFGAVWAVDWRVEHRYTDTLAGLVAFRGSKYLQSDIRQSYKEVLDFLRQGRKVLFSGTPCQCRGLKLFLKKEYDNLIIIDFICHGVPSSKVFKAYLKDEINNFVRQDEKNSVLHHPIHHIAEMDTLAPEGWRLEGVRFRDKTNGWKKFSFALTLAKVTTAGEKNTVLLSPIFPDSSYMRGFGANLYLRPSCHNCPTRGFSSGSDITLADYWGVDEQLPELDDDKGLSLVAIHTEKALSLLEHIQWLDRHIVNPTRAYKSQLCLRKNTTPSPYVQEFWESNYDHDFINIVNQLSSRRTLKQRAVKVLKYPLRKLGVKKVYRLIKHKL